jgi:hypothetical protein
MKLAAGRLARLQTLLVFKYKLNTSASNSRRTLEIALSASWFKSAALCGDVMLVL